MNNLREWRKSKNLKAETLAKILNITTPHYYDLETGRKRINEDYLKILADTYKVSLGYILGIEKSPIIIGDNTKGINPDEILNYLREKKALLTDIEALIKQLEALKNKL